VPCICKYVATSRVFSEEEAIMRAQELELIYMQSDMIYKILLDTQRSTFDLTKPKSGPHADGIVVSTQNEPTDKFSNQM
jgi:hypothetical protein